MSEHTDPSAEGSGSSSLQEFRRLSHSPFWQTQRDYYRGLGIEAWSVGGTPHQITTNPSFAASYAAVLTGWLRDVAAAGPRGPQGSETGDDHVTIVELGAGSGRFAFHLLGALTAGLGLPALRELSVRYVMTDLSEANLDWWRDHPRLRPFVEAGVLDFACFDVGDPGPLRLRESGQVLTTTRWPVAVVANYVFDSTPQDSFALVEGVLHENLVRVRQGASASAGGPLEAVVLEVQRRALDLGNYDELGLRELLEEYVETVGDTNFTLSTTALRCLEYFSCLSAGGLLMLLGDKGPVELDQLGGRSPPELVEHGGSISLPVNLHGLGRALARRGGTLLHTSQRHRHFEIVAGLLGGEHTADWAETRRAYTRAIGLDNPVETFELRQWACAEAEERPLSHALSLLGHSRFDTEVFEAVGEQLVAGLDDCSEAEAKQVVHALEQVLGAWFPTPDGEDVAFEVGLILMELGDYAAGRRAFEASLDWLGPDVATLVNLGSCLLELGETDAACRRAEGALVLEPGSEEAGELLVACGGLRPAT